jgi:sugar lactone lactonase YvrE
VIHLDVQCVLRAGAINGECPRWRAEESRLYWVDMRAPALHRLDPSTGEDQCWDMPDWIGCYVFEQGGEILVALRGGVYRLDPDSGGLRRMADPPYDQQRFCFNDGGCDPKGRFYVGPLFAPKLKQNGPTRAPVWRFEGRGWTAVTDPVQISNGLAWSADGGTLYHADTARKTIWKRPYDLATGEVGAAEVFAVVELGGPDGGPDGAVVDRDGFYICAVFGAGCLLRFDPGGRLERRIALPARYPTMPAFGGENLDMLFVTSASFPIPKDQRGAHPDDGAIFALEAPAPGVAVQSYKPSGAAP